MIKIIIALFLIVLSFTAGYIFRAKNISPFQRDLSPTQAFVATKDIISGTTDELMKKLEQTRLRLRLSELKNRISNTRAEIIARNFGMAKNEIQEASKALDSLIADANPELREDLTPIVVLLDEAKDGINKSESNMESKLETILIQIEGIQNKTIE